MPKIANLRFWISVIYRGPCVSDLLCHAYCQSQTHLEILNFMTKVLQCSAMNFMAKMAQICYKSKRGQQ